MPRINVKEYELLEFVLSCAEQQPARGWTRMPGWRHSSGVEGAETFLAHIIGVGSVSLASHRDPGAIIYSLEWHNHNQSPEPLLYAEDGPDYHNIADLYHKLERTIQVQTPARNTASAVAAPAASPA